MRAACISQGHNQRRVVPQHPCSGFESLKTKRCISIISRWRSTLHDTISMELHSYLHDYNPVGPVELAHAEDLHCCKHLCPIANGHRGRGECSSCASGTRRTLDPRGKAIVIHAKAYSRSPKKKVRRSFAEVFWPVSPFTTGHPHSSTREALRILKHVGRASEAASRLHDHAELARIRAQSQLSDTSAGRLMHPVTFMQHMPYCIPHIAYPTAHPAG